MTDFKEVPMSEWGIGDHALYNETEVRIVDFDGDKAVLMRREGGHGPLIALTADLKPLEIEGATIPTMPTPKSPADDPFRVGEIVIDTEGKSEGGYEARVIEADGYRRKVISKLGGDTEHSYWAYVSQLKPLPSTAVSNEQALKWGFEQAAGIVTEKDSKIAQLEMDLSHARADALNKVAGLEQRLKGAEGRIDDLTKQAAGDMKMIETLSRDLNRSADINDDLERKLTEAQAEIVTLNQRLSEALNTNATQSRLLAEATETIRRLVSPKDRPQFEIKTIYDPSDEALTALINTGWNVVFETVYVHRADERNGDEVHHQVRLQREVKTPAYVPRPEAHAEAPTPTPPQEPEPVATPEQDDDYVIVGSHWEDDDEPQVVTVPLIEPTPESEDTDQDEEVEETTYPEPVFELEGVGATVSPFTAYMMNQAGRQRNNHPVSRAPRPRNMQRRAGVPGPKYAPDAIDHYVMSDGKLRVGGVVIDPEKMPIAATILQHGLEATKEGLNEQIRQKVAAVVNNRPRFTPPAFRSLLPGQS